jgi:predicted  nucleic acid-binding Zn-ribbon protein
MATNQNPDEQRELNAVQHELDKAKQSTDARSDKVDDLTSRFRELRRKNHFRLMLEELFNE